jgi:hypothetical protein
MAVVPVDHRFFFNQAQQKSGGPEGPPQGFRTREFELVAYKPTRARTNT